MCGTRVLKEPIGFISLCLFSMHIHRYNKSSRYLQNAFYYCINFRFYFFENINNALHTPKKKCNGIFGLNFNYISISVTQLAQSRGRISKTKVAHGARIHIYIKCIYTHANIFIYTYIQEYIKVCIYCCLTGMI